MFQNNIILKYYLGLRAVPHKKCTGDLIMGGGLGNKIQLLMVFVLKCIFSFLGSKPYLIKHFKNELVVYIHIINIPDRLMVEWVLEYLKRERKYNVI